MTPHGNPDVHRLYSEFRQRRDPAWRPSDHPLARLCSIAAMQYVVLATWIAFRVTDLATMRVALEKFVWFDFDLRIANLGLGARSFFSSLLLLAGFFALHALSRATGQLDYWLGSARLGGGALRRARFRSLLPVATHRGAVHLLPVLSTAAR